MPEPIRHTRPIPEEWPELCEYAAAQVPQPGHDEGFSKQQVQDLRRYVLKIPNERREANLYYGVGEVLCGVAKNLQNEATYTEVVRKAALKTVELALQSRTTIPLDKPFQPQIQDLSGRDLADILYPTAVEAQQSLPPWHRALTGALLLGRLEAQPRYTPKRFLDYLLIRSAGFRGVSHGYPVPYRISHNAFSGAIAVFTALLSGVRPPNSPSDEAGTHVITPEGIERVRRSRAFWDSARLNLIEFNEGRGWIGQGETLEFDRGYTRRTRPQTDVRLADGSRPRHYERLECPALQAGGLAVKMARTIVPDIITTAQHVVPRNFFKVTYPQS